MRTDWRWVSVVAMCAGVALHAQSPSPAVWGRVSFTAQSFTAVEAGQALPGFTEMVVAGTLASSTRDDPDTEYRLDFRGAGYPGTLGRSNRMSIYDAYFGQRIAGGIRIRAGQMWLNDLGGLGALGGGLVELGHKSTGRLRRVRFGVFGGLEPEVLNVGYVSNVTKAGGYVTLEGNGAWRNTLGYVLVRNSGMTERSVLTTTNFLPFGRKLLFYQSAEYDVAGAAAHASSGLSYFFTNARYSPLPALEFQAVYHRGRSIDARAITLDQLAGRQVSASALEGLLYESIGGRATVAVGAGVRVFAGYTTDRNNREDAPTARTTYGAFATNLLKTGIDVNVSDSRMHGPSSTYDSWDASVGRTAGPRMYLTAQYSTSLSAFRMISQDAFSIEARPRTNRISLSDLIRLTARTSVLTSIDRTQDGTLSEKRWLVSVVQRF